MELHIALRSELVMVPKASGPLFKRYLFLAKVIVRDLATRCLAKVASDSFVWWPGYVFLVSRSDIIQRT